MNMHIACNGSFFADGTSDGVNWNAEWSVIMNSQYVSFTVRARTTGYVAIGFSLNQIMVRFYNFVKNIMNS